MRRQNPWISGVIATLMLAGGTAMAAQIHEHASDAVDRALSAPAKPQPTTSPGDMRTTHETLRAAMHARQATLASLVKTMDGATGEAKIDTMAAIIRELVLSDNDMRARMDAMNEAAAQKDAK